MKSLAENTHLTPLGDALENVDQPLLPMKKRLITLKTREELYRAIYTLQVRGAPAIGIFAGYALYVLAQQIDTPDFSEFFRLLSQDADYLESSRPTAVNLSWALRRMLNCAKSQAASREELLEALLQEAGVDVTLICDNMASLVMAQGKINACLVGCDRIAANGDTANKIGTSGVAVLAHHYGIPFYVLGPSSTIDMNCLTGKDIVIEERPGEEIRSKFYAQPQAPLNVKCYNPAFDVTDARLISGIVTEKGIFRYPYTEKFQEAFAN